MGKKMTLTMKEQHKLKMVIDREAGKTHPIILALHKSTMYNYCATIIYREQEAIL